jgi:hypothetical protein
MTALHVHPARPLRPAQLPVARPGRPAVSRRSASAALVRWWIGVRARLLAAGPDRGDVPGWVLVTLMTAGLVLALWALAGPALTGVFSDSIARVTGAIGG